MMQGSTRATVAVERAVLQEMATLWRFLFGWPLSATVFCYFARTYTLTPCIPNEQVPLVRRDAGRHGCTGLIIDHSLNYH